MWILFIYWTRQDAYMYITCFQYKIQLQEYTKLIRASDPFVKGLS